MNQSAHSIPDDILDQACHWSVVLGDSRVSEDDQRNFARWLESNPLHQTAWQRLQMVEQELVPARPLARQGSDILQGLAKSRRQRKTVFASALSVLLLLGIAQLLFPYWQADYVTGKGELQQISLDSGAIIYLDSGVALDVESAGDKTIVQLHRGRILVDSSAASPAQKPQVITDHARFTPIGTRFVITKRGDLSELIVTQGQVQVDADGNSRVANAGDSLQIANKTIAPLINNGLAPDAWVDGVIEANNARLGDLLDALAQHRRGWLRYDAKVAELRVNGIFYLNDTDKALTSLSNTLPITVETHAGWWTNVKPK
ncbi:MAG: DUF4880 domain-containing protein [Cellvibrio sp.]|uniref:DUF4880 domain-containing protein n=1 Tax=Cellvibrio sp. TaxID=1965322 RepID=UPI0031AA64E4